MAGRTHRPGAAIGLYCFPHAGGAPGEFVRWSADLPGVWVRAVRPPGRGSRLFERPFTRMGDLVEAVLDHVVFEPPFALFGHSLGALVAFETARALRDRPARLIVSGCPAPEALPESALHTLADRDLLTEIERRWGPLPDEVRTDPDLLDRTLRGFRADLELLETYRYRPGPPLDLPVTALAGADDKAAAGVAGWRDHTSGPFDAHVFPGGHFYFREHRLEVLDHLRRSIEEGAG